MVVVSDTSCLVALAHIGALDLLNKTFNEIHIPSAVYTELLLLKEYGIDVSIFSASWIKVHQSSDLPLVD
jgi:predicted nucleic acid-binding protein